jgi:hypothetical protein
MASQEGVNFYISWGLLEWALTGALTTAGGFLAWLWHLAGRVGRLEDIVAADREEILMVKHALKEIGRELNEKIDGETARLEERMEGVRSKLEELREDLPSRQFIEGQLGLVTQRIDRMIDVKMAGRG